MDRKVVLVTGSSRGIGLAIAKKFALNNYNIVLNYNNSEEKALDSKKELEQLGVKVLLVKCDVSNELEVKGMIEKVISEYGKLNCVVNNAAICNDKELLSKTAKDFTDILSINLVGSFLVSKYSYEYLKKENNASIINISSTNGIDSYYPESADYDASKAGLISLTHNLAKELIDIRVNCVAPGWVNTDMSKDLSPIYKKEEEEKIIMKRFGEPEEIASAVYFLASEDASYITSTIIRVDGGSNK